MKDLNVFIATGRLVKDFEAVGQSGKLLVSSIAVNSRTNDKATQQWTDKASFFNIKVFGKWNIEKCGVIHKGDMITIQGNWEQSTYEKDGQKRYNYGINIDSIDKIAVYMRPKQEQQPQQPRQPQQYSQQPQRQQAPQYQPPAQPPQGQGMPQLGPEDYDDDIPF